LSFPTPASQPPCLKIARTRTNIVDVYRLNSETIKNCPPLRIEVIPTELPRPHALNSDASSQLMTSLRKPTTISSITAANHYWQNSEIEHRLVHTLMHRLLTCDLDFLSRPAMVMTHIHAENEGHRLRSIGEWIESKRTDGHNRPHYFSSLMRLISKNTPCQLSFREC